MSEQEDDYYAENYSKGYYTLEELVWWGQSLADMDPRWQIQDEVNIHVNRADLALGEEITPQLQIMLDHALPLIRLYTINMLIYQLAGSKETTLY